MQVNIKDAERIPAGYCRSRHVFRSLLSMRRPDGNHDDGICQILSKDEKKTGNKIDSRSDRKGEPRNTHTYVQKLSRVRVASRRALRRMSKSWFQIGTRVGAHPLVPRRFSLQKMPSEDHRIIIRDQSRGLHLVSKERSCRGDGRCKLPMMCDHMERTISFLAWVFPHRAQLTIFLSPSSPFPPLI